MPAPSSAAAKSRLWRWNSGVSNVPARQHHWAVHRSKVALRAERLLHLVGEPYIGAARRQPDRLRSYMPEQSSAPLMMQRAAETETPGPVRVTSATPARWAPEEWSEMKSRSGLAAKLPGIAMHPGDRPAHLIGHRHQAAARFAHRDVVRDYRMRAGPDHHLAEERIVSRGAATPGAAMDEDLDRRRPAGKVRRRIDVERLNRRRAVSEPARLADARAREVAVGRVAPEHLARVRRVFALIVGVVERLLVEIEPNRRAVRACGLRRGGTRGKRNCPAAGSDQRPPVERAAGAQTPLLIA